MPITGFTIYYGDGSTYTSGPGKSWPKAPATGVQYVILWHAKPYCTIVTGVDAYTHPDHPLDVKLGSLLSDAAYATICDRAIADWDKHAPPGTAI